MTKHQQFVVVRVEDTGMGIAPEHLPLIFQRFGELTARARRIEGSGLGLAIAQLIVQQHGGKITSSQVGLVAASRCTCRLVLIFLDERECVAEAQR